MNFDNDMLKLLFLHALLYFAKTTGQYLIREGGRSKKQDRWLINCSANGARIKLLWGVDQSRQAEEQHKRFDRINSV